MTICQGVLLDTVSIQGYIFQSNELKENVGASYIIENLVYRDYLKEAVEDVLPSVRVDPDEWRKPPFEVKGCDPFEIGYVGGGNALLLFREKEDARAFIRKWTRILMVKAPQVSTAIALDDDFDLSNFQDRMKHLFYKLRKNKLQFSPQTVIPAHGITAECIRSGFSQNKWNENVKTFVSAAAYARIDAADGAWKKINSSYKEILKDRFAFPKELSELNRVKEDSYISIVHIDGNDIGKHFFGSESEIHSLPDMRENAVKIDEITRFSFNRLLSYIVNPNNDNKMKKEKILPIRPIILGGDDVTFVCDGKMGIYFAQIYMEFFEDEAKSKGLTLTACAGIAIIKTKYPFYRGYCLAEELCRNAKRIRKHESGEYSYLDFHIASGAIAGSLEDIRKIHFTSPQGRLYCRPYRMSKDIQDEKNFYLLLENTKELKENFPKNKRHGLCEVLTMNETARNRFLAEMKARGRKLPVIPGKSFDKNLFDSITESGEEMAASPYMDMIELIEYYPFLSSQDS